MHSFCNEESKQHASDDDMIDGATVVEAGLGDGNLLSREKFIFESFSSVPIRYLSSFQDVKFLFDGFFQVRMNVGGVTRSDPRAFVGRLSSASGFPVPDVASRCGVIQSVHSSESFD